MSTTANQIATAFISYLKEQERYDLLPEITEALHEEVLRNQDISVIAATELSEKERKELEKELVEKWGEHRVVFTTDSTILSGIIVRFHDTILDLSGRTGLRELKETLTSSL